MEIKFKEAELLSSPRIRLLRGDAQQPHRVPSRGENQRWSGSGSGSQRGRAIRISARNQSGEKKRERQGGRERDGEAGEIEKSESFEKRTRRIEVDD